MGRFINTGDLHNVVMKRKEEYGRFSTLIDNIIEEMVGETPTAEVIDKERYEVLQSENNNMRDKINKSIKRIEDLADENHDKDSCKDFCSGLLIASMILKNDLKE